MTITCNDLSAINCFSHDRVLIATAMSTAARPRPRPKPRPRVPSVVPSSPGPSSSFKSPPPPSAPHVITIDDEEALFIRKPALDWSRKPNIAEDKKRKASQISSDVEVEDSPRKKQPKKSTGKQKAVSHDWTKSSNLDFISLSSDEDDDIFEARVTDSKAYTKRSRHHADKQSGNKRSRSRSRSLSLTPPPTLSKELLQSAVDKIRDIITIEARPPSPTSLVDDSADNLDLDPELALVRRQVKSGHHAHTPGASRGNTPARDGGPETVTIRVKWKPHPLNEAGRPQEWDFRMKRHESFKALFEETADEAAILSDNLIVTHEGTRVFPSASPHGLGVWAEAELEACDKGTFEYIRDNRRRSVSVTRDDDEIEVLGFTNSLPTTQEEDEEEPAEVEDKGDKFKILLRSSNQKDVSLTVRPTTTCGAIVKAYLKSLGLTDKYPGAGEVAPKAPAKKGRKAAPTPSGGPWLVIEGEKKANNAPIGDDDLEDGDMVEVTGL
ncbi:hypothetical protein BXZ70DRAFT_956978 [Cristinia sonorae]|uniref:Rad60/SUMO-like domain-containing protein n=1 Tax=Cristinia sonorae TaxID=1940300 RepID=A0A8K0XKV6_9AGAR|nr:hypothetical protein BXZ70DRAFT_956978 [Cristinia sonorae]